LPCWFLNTTYLICLCISTVTHNFHYSSCKYFTMNKMRTADDKIISQIIFSWTLKYTFWINSNLHPMGHLHRETRSGFSMFMSEEDIVHFFELILLKKEVIYRLHLSRSGIPWSTISHGLLWFKENHKKSVTIVDYKFVLPSFLVIYIACLF